MRSGNARQLQSPATRADPYWLKLGRPWVSKRRRGSVPVAQRPRPTARGGPSGLPPRHYCFETSSGGAFPHRGLNVAEHTQNVGRVVVSQAFAQSVHVVQYLHHHHHPETPMCLTSWAWTHVHGWMPSSTQSQQCPRRRSWLLCARSFFRARVAKHQSVLYVAEPTNTHPDKTARCTSTVVSPHSRTKSYLAITHIRIPRRT